MPSSILHHLLLFSASIRASIAYFGKTLVLSATLAALVVTSTGAESFAQENNQPPAGFKSLFNGKDLSGWHGLNMSPYKLDTMSQSEKDALLEKNASDIEAHWGAVDGVIANDGQGLYLTTDEEYGDIELWVDYRMAPEGDSGIYLRTTPQVQIWDFTEAGGKWNIGADKGSGGLWNNNPGSPGKDPLVLADMPFGQWNRFRIQQIGARTSIWLNGKQVVDNAIMHNYWNREKPLRRTGHIQLQTHGGAIDWRNIFVREIKADEATALLSGRDDDGFQSVFNGKDFSGWAGPTDNYEIASGVLRCKPGKGGTIYTEKEYDNFVARLEFKLPPGGNNGLAIRYPGQGDTAYAGMCELQVLDTEHEKYKSIDPRQAHGSAYGMVAAERGYLRDAGEWNFQEVTVKGSKIRVELNGSVILDADLADVKDYLGGRPHPGKDRKRGHFGFAGHNDAVEYRNVRIREIKSEPAKVTAAGIGSTRNVHQVGNLILAGQPGKEDIELLKGAGVGHVLDLRRKGEVNWDEEGTVKSAGLAYTRLAIAGPDSMTEDLFAEARALFRSADQNDKVFCHCGSANRVGALWLAYRVLDEGVAWEKAVTEAKEVGLRNAGLEAAAKEYVEAQSAAK